MKKSFLYILFAIFVLFNTATNAFCAAHAPKTIAVFSDTGHRNGTTYIISGAASDIIASDIINKMNQTGRIKAPLLGETMSKVTQKNIPLYYMTFFNEYKYNYNVDFVNLKRVTRNIDADYLLLVTSGMDIQSNFLKDTWWNKLNISGMDPVRPTYRLATLVTLIDKKTYQIVWQDMYMRDIVAHNYDLGVTQFSPSYSQLTKIKKYSKNMSEYVTNLVDRQVNPWIVPPQESKSIEMKSRFINEGTKLYYPTVNGEVVKQNYNEFKTETQMKWETRKRQRMQQKHIENVRRLEQKQEVKEQSLQYKKKNDERLFDSIRDNIEDVSNTLPAQQKEEIQEQNIVPAVNVQPLNDKREKTEIKEDVKIGKPVITKPVQTKQQNRNIKPVNNIQPKKVTPQEVTPQKVPPKNVPNYDWNLKNIYLEKIGSYI